MKDDKISSNKIEEFCSILKNCVLFFEKKNTQSLIFQIKQLILCTAVYFMNIFVISFITPGFLYRKIYHIYSVYS